MRQRLGFISYTYPVDPVPKDFLFLTLICFDNLVEYQLTIYVDLVWGCFIGHFVNPRFSSTLP